jgi:succinate dehydrogenase/fumarate reductase-like Fe-S protein
MTLASCVPRSSTYAHRSIRVLLDIAIAILQRRRSLLSLVAEMKTELFDSCTNHGECEAVCPKRILFDFIGK